MYADFEDVTHPFSEFCQPSSTIVLESVNKVPQFIDMAATKNKNNTEFTESGFW